MTEKARKTEGDSAQNTLRKQQSVHHDNTCAYHTSLIEDSKKGTRPATFDKHKHTTHIYMYVVRAT